jgi:hypothetical protein
MKIIVDSVQLAPPCTFVSTLSVLMSMRIMLTVIILRGNCLMQLFVSRSIPCLPDILLTEDWVETGNHDVVGVLLQRLEEHSLVLCGDDGVGEVSPAGSVGPTCCSSALSSSHLILFFSPKSSSRICFLSMAACCWIRSSWATSISFRWTSSSSRVVVFTRGMLAYTWLKFLVVGGHVASMLDVSGWEHAELEWEV